VPRWLHRTDRDPGPRPSTSFKYQLRRKVLTNSPSSPTANNLVSQVLGSASAAHAMSSASAVGGGSGIAAKEVKELTMADVASLIRWPPLKQHSRSKASSSSS
jgi:hypothetical protein